MLLIAEITNYTASVWTVITISTNISLATIK
jgi:hypothetical protein